MAPQAKLSITHDDEQSAPSKKPNEYRKCCDFSRLAPNGETDPFSITLTRHHIVPRNRLATLWNWALENQKFTLLHDLFQAMAHNLTNYNCDGISKEIMGRLLTLLGDLSTYDDNGEKKSAVDEFQAVKRIYLWLPANWFVGPDADFRCDDPDKNLEAHIEEYLTDEKCDIFPDLQEVFNACKTLIETVDQRLPRKRSNRNRRYSIKRRTRPCWSHCSH
ncbi:hypothetical protein ACQEU6_24535 [Spirillospora sp. CA-108201]